MENAFQIGEIVIAHHACREESMKYEGQLSRITEIRDDGVYTGQFLKIVDGVGAENQWVAAEFITAQHPDNMAALVAFMRELIHYGEAQHKYAASNSALLEQDLIDVKAKRDDAMRIISERIYAEADKRGWCEDVNTFMADLDDSLPHGFNLDLRKQKFTIHAAITGSSTVYVDVEVEATSRGEAEDLFRCDPDDYCDPAELLNDNYRHDWENIEVEID